MATKRSASQELVENPFIKKRNLEWSLDITGRTYDAVGSSSSDEDEHEEKEPLFQGGGVEEVEGPKSAAIEAGEAGIDDHLGHFSNLLAKATISSFPSDAPHLSVEGYRKLYEANAGKPGGAHFIIHQHDHPIAGTHYDLRLQINETSSVSWAIMYGLPGDPNSFKLNRNATETRIHCLWNHLIETASHATGSLLIWDTGTYSVLPVADRDGKNKNNSSRNGKERKEKYDSQSSAHERDKENNHYSTGQQTQQTEQEKLHQAFAARKIRLELHGTRLPAPYVVNLRLTREEDAVGRARSTRVPKTTRRRGGGPLSRTGGSRKVTKGRVQHHHRDTDSDTESDNNKNNNNNNNIYDGDDSDDNIVHPSTSDKNTTNTEGQQQQQQNTTTTAAAAAAANLSAMEREIREIEDAQVRLTNA